MAEQLKERKDIESAYLWDLTPIYESDEAWEKAFAQTESLADRFASYPGTLGQSPEHLLRLPLRSQRSRFPARWYVLCRSTPL